MILIAFRHGLRASQLVTLRWDAIDLDHGKVHCNRRKNGAASVHPLAGVELRALRRVKRDLPKSPFVFVSERGAPFTVGGFPLSPVVRRFIECAHEVAQSFVGRPERRKS